MPETKHQPRVIRGSMPTRTGSYAGSTRPQLHGKGSNKTADFIAGIDPLDPGHQAFYREALTGIQHPLDPAQQVSYGQYQQLLNGPQRAAALEAYRVSNRLDKAPTAEQMQQAAFDNARHQLIQRGAANPGEYAFPTSAIEALRAPTTGRLIRNGNFATPDQKGQMATTETAAQRFANTPPDQDPVMAAPGMAVRLIRAAPTAVPAPKPKIIAGTIASR